MQANNRSQFSTSLSLAVRQRLLALVEKESRPASRILSQWINEAYLRLEASDQTPELMAGLEKLAIRRGVAK